MYIYITCVAVINSTCSNISITITKVPLGQLSCDIFVDTVHVTAGDSLTIFFYHPYNDDVQNILDAI